MVIDVSVDPHPFRFLFQAQQYQQTPNQTYVEPEETPDYSQYYQPTPAPQPAMDQPTLQPADQPASYQPSQVTDQPAPAYSEQYSGPGADEPAQYQYADWTRTEETHSQSYGDPYWTGDNTYNYAEVRAFECGRARTAESTTVEE